MKPALLLNSTYEPISIINWKQSFKLVCRDKAQVLECYDQVARSPSGDHNVPSVIRLKERVHVKREEVQFKRKNVYRRDNYTCQYCGRRLEYNELTFDHVLPQSRGGQTRWKNIVTCCEPCNLDKDDRTPDEANMELLSEPSKPGMLPFGMSLFIEDKSEEWDKYLWV